MRRNTSKLGLFFSSVISLLFGLSCGSPQSGLPAVSPADSSAFSTARAVLKYAHGFSIDYYDHYKEVKILNRSGNKTDTLDYLLVQEGHPAPGGHPGAQIISIPVKTLVVMSSMHVGMADFAGIADRIIGLGSTQYVNSPIVREGIRTGKVKQVGIDANVNNELIISMHPGLLMSMTNPDAAFGQYKTLTEAGVPVLPNAEWLETTPLGRAEWVKLAAALVNKEEDVNKKFDSVEAAYQRLAAIGSQSKTKPSVILGMPWKGSWYMPAGGSYMTRFLADAGATYKWSDTKGTGSLPLNFETVAPEALTADFWLNVGYVDSKNDVLAKDSRFSGFHSFQTGAIYNYNHRINDLGSNDYWESGEVNPQHILADLIRILHPGALPQDTLYYYKQLK
jgi:iron complex transport system substrate-binding protein